MILTLVLEALLFVQSGGSAVPAPDDESPGVQAEQRSITETSEIEVKGDAADSQQMVYGDRHEHSMRHDSHDENARKEGDYYEDAGKGAAGGEPAPDSSDIEPK